ncbi:MAG: TIR domain-containing protein [Anaerolineae bacterium]|nr:TIR domain-containing protein [Anaerolineae bacterium]
MQIRYDLFISHATADDAIADRLFEACTAAGLRVWVDHREGIVYGDLWERKIRLAIGESAKGLFLMSRRSLQSEFCEAECQRILSLGKPLYVALLEPIEDRNAIPLLISRIQYADLTRPETFAANLAKLIAVLRGDSSAAAAPSAPTAAQYARLTSANGVDRRLTSLPLIGREADLEAVRDHLKKGDPTFILGVGGVGKSRLAYEIALQGVDGVRSVVWYVCSDVSEVDDLRDLLREHYNLPPATQFRDVLRRIDQERCLVVIDNAEALSGRRREDHKDCVEQLAQHKACVLITSRVAWQGLSRIKQHAPSALSLDAAARIAAEMAQVEQVEGLSEADLRALAEAARLHPRLIEWSIMQVKERPFSRVLDELRSLRGKRVEEALREMILKTRDQMAADEPDGAEAAALLKWLNVCRGGFTFAAAAALHTAGGAAPDEGKLEDLLSVLIKWRFISRVGKERYVVYPLVTEAVGEDESAYQAHADYYKMLVERHTERQDFGSIADEVDNVVAAYERLRRRDVVAVFWFASTCYKFLLNRGRARLCAEWIIACADALRETEDAWLRAALHNSLGNAYCTLARVEDQVVNLHRAIEAYYEALRFFTPDAAPLDYAATQHNLGNAYSDLAKVEDRVVNLRRAIEAYYEALRFRTPDDAPLDYTRTQHNLGNAYSALAQVEDRAANLHRAIAAYHEALRFRTPDTAPLDYAGTQNNLGNAYSALAQVEDRAANLRRAIAAYREALRFYTPEAAPLNYAAMQHSLGVAYSALAQVEDRVVNLSEAITACHEALRFYTPDDAPLHYAETQAVLGIAYKELGDIASACACWREAEYYFFLMDDIEQGCRVYSWLEENCDA